VPVTVKSAVQIVGEPQLNLTYSGTGAGTHVFAQLVDEQRGVVVGNQATPIPVTLDGRSHTLARPLEAIAASAAAGASYTLQIIGGTLLYGPVRGAAAITFSKIDLTLPTIGAAAVSGGAGVLPTTRTCLSRRRFSIRVPGSHPKVTVAGKRVKVRRGRAIVDLRGKPKGSVTVRVTARRKGRTVRETRVYKTCAPRTVRATG
jgi:ABC-2 type transport system ATP-binding protein